MNGFFSFVAAAILLVAGYRDFVLPITASQTGDQPAQIVRVMANADYSVVDQRRLPGGEDFTDIYTLKLLKDHTNRTSALGP